MIRTLLIDDEPLARKRLRQLLAGHADLDIVGEAANGSEAVLKIENLRPDLILLDVQMPDLDGFGVLKMVEVDTFPLVIFVTAHDRYAVDAFEVRALDYLLKPVRRQRLDEALGKAREKLKTREAAGAQLQQFLKQTSAESKSYLRRLPARTQKRIFILNVDQITSFRIDQGLVYVTTPQGEYWTKHTTFSQLEEQLDPSIFFRVHRQTIVNLNRIQEVHPYDNNTADLTLSCGHKVSVSRSQMARLREILDL